MRTWLVDGEVRDVVSLDDRGLAYGDGLFETIAWRNHRPRFCDRHMARLTQGCQRLAIPAPSPALIAAEMGRVAGSHGHGTIKILVTRGAGRRGYAADANLRPTRAIGFEPAVEAGPTPAHAGVTVTHCRTPASCNPALAGVKTLQRLDNVLARAEWAGEEVMEGLMFDTEERVIGGTMTNLFMVRGGQLLTPALSRAGIRGVMRSVVLDLAHAAGLRCEETDIDRECLAEAQEMFLTNALIGLWPVVCCSGRRLRPGPVIRRLTVALARSGVEECAT